MPDDFVQRLIQCIAKTQHIPAENITIDSSFEQLGIDSLDGINILFALENEFGVNIPDNAAQQVKTIRDMAQGVYQLMEAQQAQPQAQ
ncbi:MAG: acyl carrier protein [Acidobacteria bacterium]|nr:acyl carrier protein [Acidobacteriota bacterium]